MVIRPDPALAEDLAVETMGPALFPLVFTKGAEMAGAGAIAVPGPPQGYWAFDAALGMPRWWGWFSWYTDGRSVAAYIRRYDGGAHAMRAGDPWF